MRKTQERLYKRLENSGVSKDKLSYFKNLELQIADLKCIVYIFQEFNLETADAIRLFDRIRSLSNKSIPWKKTAALCLMEAKWDRLVESYVWRILNSDIDWVPALPMYKVICFYKKNGDAVRAREFFGELSTPGKDIEKILRSELFIVDKWGEKPLSNSQECALKDYLAYVVHTENSADPQILRKDILGFMMTHDSEMWSVWKDYKNFYELLQKENPYLGELKKFFQGKTGYSTIPEEEIRKNYPMEAKDEYIIRRENMKAYFNIKKGSAELNFCIYRGIRIRTGQEDEKISGYYMQNRRKIIFFFSDASVYYEAGNHSLYPLSIQKLLEIRRTFGDLNAVFECILSSLYNSGGFGRSVTNLITSESCLLKIKLSDVMKYRSFEHYFVNTYKGTGLLKSKMAEGDTINRHHPEYFYMLLRVMKKIQELDLKRLLSLRDRKTEEQIVEDFKQRKEKIVMDFKQRIDLDEMLCSIFRGVNPWTKKNGYMEVTFLENCQWAKNAHQKVRVFYPGKQALYDEADRMENLARCRAMKVIKIPRDSVFHKLNKALPKDFMRIRTRKALKEICFLYCGIAGERYDDEINQDKAALFWQAPFLYVFVNKDTDYEVEAIYEKEKRLKKSSLKFQKLLEQIQPYMAKGDEE